MEVQFSNKHPRAKQALKVKPLFVLKLKKFFLKKHTEKKSLQCKIYTKLIVKFEVAGSILCHNCSYQAWLCAAEQLSAHTSAISGVQYLYALMLHQIILPADMQE